MFEFQTTEEGYHGGGLNDDPFHHGLDLPLSESIFKKYPYKLWYCHKKFNLQQPSLNYVQ